MFAHMITHVMEGSVRACIVILEVGDLTLATQRGDLLHSFTCSETGKIAIGKRCPSVIESLRSKYRNLDACNPAILSLVVVECLFRGVRQRGGRHACS